MYFNKYLIKKYETSLLIKKNLLMILSEKLGNEELSVDRIVEKFINTTNSIAKD